jgi:hypothetical protein
MLQNRKIFEVNDFKNIRKNKIQRMNVYKEDLISKLKNKCSIISFQRLIII